MIRISRLTDYGIILLTHFAREGTRATMSARQLSVDSEIPLPTVGKLLKLLTKADLLKSERGINGGYHLSRDPQDISIAQVIETLEGPIGFSDCIAKRGSCGREKGCGIRGSWARISHVVNDALENLSLAEMSKVPGAGHVPGSASSPGQEGGTHEDYPA